MRLKERKHVSKYTIKGSQVDVDQEASLATGRRGVVEFLSFSLIYDFEKNKDIRETLVKKIFIRL